MMPPSARQVLDAIILKTYGWNKKQDAVAYSQIADITGLPIRTVKRAVKWLLEANIIASDRNDTSNVNVYAVNKHYGTWKVVTGTTLAAIHGNKNKEMDSVVNDTTPASDRNDTITSVVNDTPASVVGGQKLVTGTTPTINKDKRHIINKQNRAELKNADVTEKQQRPFAEVEIDFRKAMTELMDEAYADKTINQARQLMPDYRVTYEKKVRVCVNSYNSNAQSTKLFAKKVMHEIAGFVNDFGDMQKRLSEKDIANRKQFEREDIGRVSDDDVNSFL